LLLHEHNVNGQNHSIFGTIQLHTHKQGELKK